MKKIVALLVVFGLLSSVSLAQSLRDVVCEYQDNNSEMTIVIPSFLFKMGIAFGDLEEEEKEVLNCIDNMKIVVSESNFQNSDFGLLDEGLKSGKFAEVMTVREQDETVRMIVNKKNKRKSELLMLVESDDENVLMLFNFHGEPDFKKFACLVD